MARVGGGVVGSTIGGSGDGGSAGGRRSGGSVGCGSSTGGCSPGLPGGFFMGSELGSLILRVVTRGSGGGGFTFSAGDAPGATGPRTGFLFIERASLPILSRARVMAHNRG
jgi:hypothetical protein